VQGIGPDREGFLQDTVAADVLELDPVQQQALPGR
jgi:hypothetical protein